MDRSRRAFIGGAAAAAGLSLVPRTALAAASRDKTYGVIEIRASAMSVASYTLDLDSISRSVRRSGFDRMAPDLTGAPFPESERASPLGPAAADTPVSQAVDTVAGYVDGLKARHDLQSEDVAVLISTSAVDASPERTAQFTADLLAKTGIQADVISIHEQSRLAYDWIVAPMHRNRVLHFDISAGFTKGGYYASRDRNAQFTDLAVGYGTKSMEGEVKRRWPEVRTADFGQRASEFYRDTIEPLLAPQLAAAPLAAQLPELCLTGGIVWASTVIIHPQAIARGEKWVELAPDHFAKLLALIANGTPYGGQLPEDLNRIERERVHDLLEHVRKAYNPHQLSAGAAIGDGLCRQLHASERERLSFAGLSSFAGNVWVGQYLLEKFG